MSANSKIEWTDHTFSPWWGCAKVSPACDFCYAEAWAKRTGFPGLWGVDAARRSFGDKRWAEPLKWERLAVKEGRRFRVFCASMADVFDKNAPEGARDRLWELILATPHLDWLLLTKRIGNVSRMVPQSWMVGHWPANALLGISVVNQPEADRDIPKLLALQARVRFLSCEPLLGPIDLNRIVLASNVSITGTDPRFDKLNFTVSALRGAQSFKWPPVNWVIVGGESGHKARPMEVEWARSLKIQCEAAGTAFFMKQLSQANWPDFKNFESFPPSLQVRQWPT